MKKLLVTLAALSLAGAAAAQTGVKIDGVTWAAANVGEPGTFAADPEDFGGYYTFWQALKACPAGWRVPTREEIESLACSESRWTTVNGVAGRRFGGGEGSLFLPAAGRRRASTGLMHGDTGFYWTATKATFRGRYDFVFDEEKVPEPWGVIQSHNRLSVRCVKE